MLKLLVGKMKALGKCCLMRDLEIVQLGLPFSFSNDKIGCKVFSILLQNDYTIIN